MTSVAVTSDGRGQTEWTGVDCRLKSGVGGAPKHEGWVTEDHDNVALTDEEATVIQILERAYAGDEEAELELQKREEEGNGLLSGSQTHPLPLLSPEHSDTGSMHIRELPSARGSSIGALVGTPVSDSAPSADWATKAPPLPAPAAASHAAPSTHESGSDAPPSRRAVFGSYGGYDDVDDCDVIVIPNRTSLPDADPPPPLPAAADAAPPRPPPQPAAPPPAAPLPSATPGEVTSQEGDAAPPQNEARRGEAKPEPKSGCCVIL
ncbi:hypothetical protein DIPPA_26843 [Diplonema papillatum]|nr:hypothetical protein DIPPA_26843 [Diplonema papillatum]|eukprot:gene20789-32038_t